MSDKKQTALAELMEDAGRWPYPGGKSEATVRQMARRHFVEMVALLERMQDWDQLTSSQIAGLAYQASEDARILRATLEKEAGA